MLWAAWLTEDAPKMMPSPASALRIEWCLHLPRHGPRLSAWSGGRELKDTGAVKPGLRPS
jgi:hypothetical protein